MVDNKKSLFYSANKMQEAIGRVVVVSDCAHALGVHWHGKMAEEIVDFTSFSFHAVNIIAMENETSACNKMTKKEA